MKKKIFPSIYENNNIENIPNLIILYNIQELYNKKKKKIQRTTRTIN